MPLANKATKRVFSAGACLYGFDIQDKDSLFSAYDIINEILPGQLLFVSGYKFADGNTQDIDEKKAGYFTIIEEENEITEIRLNILNLLQENNSQTLIDFINSGDREILFKTQSNENISSFLSEEAILENNYVKILITSSELISSFENEQIYELSLDFIPNLHSKLVLDDGTNPHGTTKDDLGLGSVNNTSDLEKPLSEDAKEALALKVGKLTGSSLIEDASITRLSKTSGENTGDQDLSPYELKSEKGSANGYASLFGGTVPSNQLPSYVDDILEFASLSGFPSAGETGKIYITLDTDKQYRWTGSNYLQITNGLIASTNDLTEGSNNLYFTVARVLATVLTSFTPFGSSSNLSSSDSIFTALRKLQTRVALNDDKSIPHLEFDNIDKTIWNSGKAGIESNTAYGKNALSSNTTGGANTANGVSALSSNTTGGANTANGVNALRLNTTGFANTANGVSALGANTTGGSNTANGVSALSSNTTGGANTANGVNALSSNTTGGANTANGVSALSSNTTGSNNTALGIGAGGLNRNSNDSVFIGSQTKSKQEDSTNEIVIGNDATGEGSNTVVLGNDDIENTYLKGDVHITENLITNVKTKTSATSYLFQTSNKTVAPLFTSSSAVSAVIKLNTPIGTKFVLSQWGSGTVTITGESGVTLRFPADELAVPDDQYSFVELEVVDTNEVAVIGRLKRA